MPPTPLPHTPVPPQQIEVMYPDENSEVVTAFRYLMMKELRWTMDAIARELGWANRSSVYKHVRVWEEDGTMEKARDLFRMPQAEEIKAANSRMTKNWPDVLDRMLRIATKSKSDHSAILAADWLYRHVIQPELDQQKNSSNSENAWAQKKGEFDPTEIQLPANMIKSIGSKSG